MKKRQKKYRPNKERCSSPLASMLFSLKFAQLWDKVITDLKDHQETLYAKDESGEYPAVILPEGGIVSSEVVLLYIPFFLEFYEKEYNVKFNIDLSPFRLLGRALTKDEISGELINQCYLIKDKIASIFASLDGSKAYHIATKYSPKIQELIYVCSNPTKSS